ncbi:Zn(2)-C6 fungal-type domain-containing protein [Fusarium sp. LHS14.1]|nr:Zn(2)-C6 fungal-type domain-containing protein [Fusarium sp. LHS14.1]
MPSNCQVCQRPVADSRSARQHACPFCYRTFGRVDVARRHARTCPARGDRPLPPKARRGRKLRACDNCSRVKASCDAELPCTRCSSRGIACRYSSLCHDPTHRPQTHVSSEAEPVRDDRLSLSFLLRSTDPSRDSMFDTVAADLERDLASSTEWKRDLPAPASLSGTIDPTLLLLDFSSVLLHDTPEYQSTYDDTIGIPLDLSPNISADVFAARVSSIAAELHVLAASRPHLKDEFDHCCMTGFFSPDHFQNTLDAYIRRRHYYATFIHWPTFSPDKVMPHLLLAVALVGTSYLQYRVGSTFTLSAALLEVSETYIFDELQRRLDSGANLAASGEGVEICQAAVLIVSLQSTHQGGARERTATLRGPVVASMIRRGGLIGFSHDVPPSETTWSQFIERETRIRLVTWAFINDSLLTLFCSHPPSITVKEMCGSLPCRNELWEATSQNEFEEIQRGMQTNTSSPSSFSHAISLLLSEDWSDSIAASFQQLGSPNLHHIMLGFQSLIFNHRISMLPAGSSDILLRALNRWTPIWDAAMQQIPVDERKWLGVSRYSPEVATISKRIIEVGGTEEGKSSPYLQCVGTYDMVAFHQFIRKYGLDGPTGAGKRDE